MSDLDLYAAVAYVTGEDSREIWRRGFVLTGPEDSGSKATIQDTNRSIDTTRVDVTDSEPSPAESSTA
jgi:hypothetical protein